MPEQRATVHNRDMSWRRTFRVFLVAAVTLLFAAWIAIVNPTFASHDPAHRLATDPDALRRHVTALASLPSARQYDNPESLAQAAAYIRAQWVALGLDVEEQVYRDQDASYRNLIVSFGPKDAERIVVGAHYDVCGEQPGADDNASGVAGLLELARLLAPQARALARRIDLVAYSTEEPPYFASRLMGSWVHARSLVAGNTKPRLMVSLEMIGFFADAPGTQRYPASVLGWFYPSRGDFIALVGRFEEWGAVRRAKPLFQHATALDVWSMNAPIALPGVGYSDQLGYWREGIPALMVTDTSYLRNANYHKRSDTIDTLDFARMAQVVDGALALATRY